MHIVMQAAYARIQSYTSERSLHAIVLRP